MRRPSRLLFVVPLLVLACLAQAAPALAAGPAASARGGQASGWLARQLANGSHLVTDFQGTKFPNQGGTIDAVFAFAATHTAYRYGKRATGWLAEPSILSGYIGDGKKESYAGATAKLMLAAEVRGVSVTKFGGVNLPVRLGKLMNQFGRYKDRSKFGDFSNAFSQSLAIIALSRHGGVPSKAVRYLMSSECPNGGFPLSFNKKTCASYPDATALDVQALLAAGQKAAAHRGLLWLSRVQEKNGGVADAAGDAPNANSTGLSGEAFAVGHWTGHAASARAFLLSLQVRCSGAAASRGALAFDNKGYRHSTAVSATAQGLLGVADVGLAKLTARGSSRVAPRVTCSA
jgi:hypothetical protein